MKAFLRRLESAPTLTLLSAVTFVAVQLRMLSEVTENVATPLVAGVVLGFTVATRGRLRWLGVGRPWLIGIGAVLALAVAGRFAPLQIAPGQSQAALWFASLGLLAQLPLVALSPLRPILLVLAGSVSVAALSALDFEAFRAFEVGQGSIVAASAMVMLCFGAKPSGRSMSAPVASRQRTASPRGVPVAMVLVVTITVIGALLSTTFAAQLPTLRRWVASQLQLPAPNQTTRRTSGLSTGGWIGSIAHRQRTQAMTPALKVYTQRTPGYLKTRTFTLFTGRRWVPLRRRESLRANATYFGPPLKTGLFRVGPGDGKHRRMRIENQKGIESLIFTTLHTTFLDVAGDRIRVDRNSSVVEAADSKSHTIYISEPDVLEPLAPPSSPAYTNIPPMISPDLADLADRIVGDATTDAEKIDAITTYLREEFEYSLEPFRFPNYSDAVSYFLLAQQPAHCEFFATGAVLLLRHVDVPTRYVIGFLTTELEDEYQEFWVARNRDAHAWVEAFDRDRGEWVVVDATPGAGVDESVDSVAMETGDGIEEAAASKSWLAPYWSVLRRMIRRPLTWLLLALASASALFAWRNSLWSVADPVQARRIWLERRLRRRGFTRRPNETRHQFASRLAAVEDADAWLRQAAAWQRDYAKYRFAGMSPKELADPRTWPR